MDPAAEKVLKDFFMALRICVANSAIYKEGHVIFLKSLENLKSKSDQVSVGFGTLQIFIAPKYLLVDEKKWENDPLYEELARFFHLRGVKSITFRQGVGIDELNFFISQAGKKPRDIMREGGLGNIIRNKNLPGLAVEMLDYSSILSGVKEDKDIWAFLLRKAIDEENFDEIDAIVDSFDQMIRYVGVKELMANDELRGSLEKFLSFVKIKKEKSFFQCSKQLLKGFIRNAHQLEGVDVPASIQGNINALNANDLSDVLLDEILLQETINDEFIDVFVRLLDEEKNRFVASAVFEKLKGRASARITPEHVSRILGYFSNSSQEVVVKVYQPVFTGVDADQFQEEVFHFGREVLPLNYWNMLVNLFAVEKNLAWMHLLADKIIEQGEKIEFQRKTAEFRLVFEVVLSRGDAEAQLAPCFQKVTQCITGHVEERVLQGDSAQELEFFIYHFKTSRLGAGAYYQKMFKEEIITPYLLRCFFTFFPHHLGEFFGYLRQKLDNTKLILEFIKCSQGLPPPLTIHFLMHIFLSPNPYIKIEVLKIMQKLPLCDESFLVNILKGTYGNQGVKEEALRIFMRSEKLRKKAVEAVQGIPVSFGKKNQILEENIRAIGKVGLKEAEGFLMNLKKQHTLWNRGLGQEAARVLEQWRRG